MRYDAEKSRRLIAETDRMGPRATLAELERSNQLSAADDCITLLLREGIRWQPFTTVDAHKLTPADMCLWWVPVRGEIQVFVGRVNNWPAANRAVVGRRNGSMICVGSECFFARINPPTVDVATQGALPEPHLSTIEIEPAKPQLPP